ncbi:MAG: cytochrome P450 [Acidimicrobiia bacterium]
MAPEVRSAMSSPKIDDIDLSDIEFWAKPEAEREAVFKLLRDEAPITFYEEMVIESFPQGPGYWALTRYADVMHASRHPELFCSGRGGTNIGDIPQELAEFLGSIINMDDPRHKKLRGLVSSGFGPKQLNQLLDQVHVRASSVIDGVESKGECDFVSEIAALLPLQIVCDMVGVPPSLEQSVFAQTNIILGVGDPEYVQSYEDLMSAFMTLHQMAMELGQHRLDHPTDDITSILMHAEVDGERLTVPEFASFFILLVVAGNETTRTAISHGMLALQDNPDQKALWMSDFDRYAQDAVEEIVRWSTPVIHFRRTATQDTEISGHPIKEGGKVVMFFNSANRDERTFDRPYEFDITRSPNPHVGYGGGGPHFCLGANLARREIRVMFEELLRRLPDLEITGEPARLQSSFIHGIKRMPCAFTPVA